MHDYLQLDCLVNLVKNSMNLIFLFCYAFKFLWVFWPHLHVFIEWLYSLNSDLLV